MTNKFDTQLLIEGERLSVEEIRTYLAEHVSDDCLLVVGDEELVKVHVHTDEPWKVLAYAASAGDLYDVVVENMERQERGLPG